MNLSPAFLVLLGLLAATPATAESISITSEEDGIRLNVDEVPVDKAVQALSDRFGFTAKFVRTDDQLLTGSRSGSVLEILNWVLNGDDRAVFMAKGSVDQIERVVVFGPSGASPPPAPAHSQPKMEPSPEADAPPPEDAPIPDTPADQQQVDPGQEPAPMDGGISDYGGDNSPPQ